MKSSENMWRERERKKKLITLNLLITTRSRICRSSVLIVTYLIISKEASGKAGEIYLKFRLLKDMVLFKLWKQGSAIIQRIISNLNALPHALTHLLRYILSDICMVLDYLTGVTTHYHHFILNKFDGNAW